MNSTSFQYLLFEIVGANDIGGGWGLGVSRVQGRGWGLCGVLIVGVVSIVLIVNGIIVILLCFFQAKPAERSGQLCMIMHYRLFSQNRLLLVES